MLPCGELLPLCFAAALSLQAQRHDPVLNLADRLLVNGQLDQAITEYRRYLYFHRGRPDGQVSHASSRIALAFRNKGRLQDSVAMYRSAIEAESAAEVKDSLRFELALTEMLRGRYDLADFVLIRVETFTASPSARARASFLLGVSGLYQANWSSAWSAFARYRESSDADPRMVEALKELQTRKLSVKSEAKAKLFSTFIPGLGQIYAGEWGAGVNAFLLSSGAAALVARDIAAGRWVDASLDVLNVFARFYGGNRRGAARLAAAANARAGRNLVVALERKAYELDETRMVVGRRDRLDVQRALGAVRAGR